MSDTCLSCGGLIMEQGVNYGYAGPVCYCPKDPAHQFQRPARKERSNLLSAPTPPRGEAPERVWVEHEKEYDSVLAWTDSEKENIISPKTKKALVSYIPEALAEERIAEALLSLDKKIVDEVYLVEQEEENYAAGYEQAVDDCRMWIRAAAARSETK